MKKTVTYITGWNGRGMYQKVLVDDVCVLIIHEVETIQYIMENSDGIAEVREWNDNQGSLGRN